MGMDWWVAGIMKLIVYLVGGATTILKKYEFVNGKDDIPYMMDNTIHDYVKIPLKHIISGILTHMDNKSHVPNHQPAYWC